jgi:hypothetical protein
LNSDNKNARSKRNLKPIGYGNNKGNLKVVQEDESVSGGSGGHVYLPKSNFMSIVTSP